MTDKATDIVFNLIQSMLKHSPERSYKRLNPALRSTLQHCIEAALPFRPDTFTRIYSALRGSWWFGDGQGSALGEGFYNTACSCNHSSAQQSFEQYAGRPAVLWEEDAATPVRLCVGSEFTWRGERLTVTSMRTDSLVACSYKGYATSVRGLKPGAILYSDGVYLITSASKNKNGRSALLTVVTAPEGHASRVIKRRVTIKYSEITKLRRTAKARVKEVLDRIDKCNPSTDLAALNKFINAQHFRHFELEQIQKAFNRRRELFAQAMRVVEWRNGGDGAWAGTNLILLRLKGDRIECSNGNSVSVGAAKAILPVLLEHRSRSARLNIPIEGYSITSISQENGVQIGCTLVPWDEIDHIIPLLKSHE